jgi:hypothetical protein
MVNAEKRRERCLKVGHSCPPILAWSMVMLGWGAGKETQVARHYLLKNGTHTITVSKAKGKTLTINASDVYAARKRFLSGLEPEQDAFALTLVGDKLVDLFLDWILCEYSERYRSIVTEDQRTWLRQVAILVIARHLMEQKYTRCIEQGERTFADPWVCSELCRLHLLHTLTGDLARLVHHIVRDPERQELLIDQFHADLEARMKGPFALPESLPPLLEDARLPFSLLSQGRRGDDGPQATR